LQGLNFELPGRNLHCPGSEHAERKTMAWIVVPPENIGLRTAANVPAEAIADESSDKNSTAAPIYPPQSRTLGVSPHAAEQIATYTFDQDFGRVPPSRDVAALIRARGYRPVYTGYAE
jgi:hypothetical protein